MYVVGLVFVLRSPARERSSSERCKDNLTGWFVELIFPLVSLNPTASEPLYSQLAELLLRQIREGSFSAGEKIPSENVLAQKFGIGRPTVRQATELLIGRGYLERRRGSGTFVRDQEGAVDLFSLGGTLSSFHQKGITLETTIVEPIRSVTEVRADHVFLNRESFRLQRLGKVEGEPVLLETFWFDPAVFPGLPEHELEGRSLSEIVLDAYGAEATGAHQEFRVAALSSESAALLQMERSEAVLEVARTIHFQSALSGVFALMHCRSGRFSFSQRLGTAAKL